VVAVARPGRRQQRVADTRASVGACAKLLLSVGSGGGAAAAEPRVGPTEAMIVSLWRDRR
jgi:hypothetical protein